LNALVKVGGKLTLVIEDWEKFAFKKKSKKFTV
jgi:hypothetical protein